MSGKWINPTLCTFDELVRVERGPQVVELECCDENLSDHVTHKQYRVGARDALGRLIRPEEFQSADPEAVERVRMEARIDAELGFAPLKTGDTMSCVDWDGKHRPFLWKIYQLQEVERLNHKTRQMETHKVFIKVDEVEGKDDALARAAEIYKGMN